MSPSIEFLHQQPFRALSAFNLPVGTNYEVASSGHAVTLAWLGVFNGNTGAINTAFPFGAPSRIEDSGLALQKVAARNNVDTGPAPGGDVGPLPAFIRVPPGAPPQWNANLSHFDNHYAVLTPGANTYHEFYHFGWPTVVSDSEFRAALYRVHNLEDLGHGTVLGGNTYLTASNLSILGGRLTLAKVQAAAAGTQVHHALAGTISGRHSTKSQQLIGGPGSMRVIKWPATSIDSFASNADFYNGPVPMGARFILPLPDRGGPNIDTYLNGTSHSAAIKAAIRNALFLPLQQYGYLINDDGGNGTFRTDLWLNEYQDPIRLAWRWVLQHLRMITNDVINNTHNLPIGGSWPGSGHVGDPVISNGCLCGGTPMGVNAAFDGGNPLPPPSPSNGTALKTVIMMAAFGLEETPVVPVDVPSNPKYVPLVITGTPVLPGDN